MLALVLETDGSTYAGAGDMVLFCNGSQVGWLSGGCLEPELARRAEQVSAAGQVDWIEIDTRSDDDLLSGSALGCRGRLRIALLPLRAMAGIDDVIEAWLREGVSSSATFARRGRSFSVPAITSRRGSCIRWRVRSPLARVRGVCRCPGFRGPWCWGRSRNALPGSVAARPGVAGQRGRTACALGPSRAVRGCASSDQPGRGPSWRPLRRGTGDASRFRTGPGDAGGPG